MRKITLFFLLLLAISVLDAEQSTIPALYYGEIGCSHCDVFMSKTVPEAEKAVGIEVEVTARDILDSTLYEECGRRLSSMGLDFTIFPVLFIGNNAYQGTDETVKGLHDELEYFRRHGEFRPFTGTGAQGSELRIATVPVFIAGLVDGINPCAFSTLIFFISFLSMQGRSRRDVLVTGVLFTLSVFSAYFLLGLGLLNAVRALVDIHMVRLVIRISVSAMAGIFLVLSLRDYYLAKQGRFSEIILQMSPAVKKGAHRVIRKYNSGPFLAAGVILTGFIVSLVELACTGQVYLPTIAYMVQTDRSFLGFKSLILYNLGFIIPLAAVFAAVYAGISAAALADFFRSHIHHTKLFLAAVFVILAVAIWIV